MDNGTIQISRIHKINGDSKLKAFVDLAIGDFVVKGLKIVEGKNGLFLSMPQEQGKDGKWYSSFYPVSKEVHHDLTKIVLEAYEAE